MSFKVEAQIKHRFAQSSLGAKQQSDKQASQAAIAVKERMNGLKLCMCQGSFNEHGNLEPVGVQKRFEVAEAFNQMINRRGHEHRIAWPGASNPVLGAAKFAGLLIAPPAFPQKNTMHFLQESNR